MDKIWEIHELHKQKHLFKKIIVDILRKFIGIPLTWEDIYYSFLFYANQQLVKEFDISKNVPIQKFLNMRCRFFTLDNCKKFASNKHKVLNRYKNLNEKYREGLIQDYDTIFDAKSKEIDISNLSSEEMFIYQKHFLDMIKICEISKLTNQSYYKIKKIICVIKQKLKETNSDFFEQ